MKRWADVKLVIPYVRKLRDLDTRMVHLAEFLGIQCETLALVDTTEPAEFLRNAVPEECSCFVLHPQVMKEWVGDNGLTTALACFLQSRFSRLLVHGLHVDAYDSKLVSVLSQGGLQSVQPVDDRTAVYEIAHGTKDICEAFSGLSFGPTNFANDHVFNIDVNDNKVRRLISIGDWPFMATVTTHGSEALFIAGEDLVDVDLEIGEAQLGEHFSRLVPYAMALRYIAGDECWRPSKGYASVVVDDPLLRDNYGFLNFDSLLQHTKQSNFHTSIAFIPQDRKSVV